MQAMFDSPYGMVHYKIALPGQQPVVIMDLWRFEGTFMEEHWDVIESLPVKATNPIALFWQTCFLYPVLGCLEE